MTEGTEVKFVTLVWFESLAAVRALPADTRALSSREKHSTLLSRYASVSHTMQDYSGLHGISSD